MPGYGASITIEYVAWDTAANAGKTGDVGNHTLKWIKDGTPATPTNSPSEVDSTNAPGIYKLTLTATECQCYVGMLAGKSGTTGVVVLPVHITFETQATIKKNTALAGFEFPMIDSSDHLSRKSGVSVTLTRSLDGGAFGAAANSVSEVGTSGVYKVDLAAGDLNGNTVTLMAVAAGCDDTVIEIITQP